MGLKESDDDEHLLSWSWNEHVQSAACLRDIMFSMISGCLRVIWTLPVEMLASKNKGAVSPPFIISLGDLRPVEFRIMLEPRAISENKGDGSFKKAKGKGKVFVKCNSAIAIVKDYGTTIFRIGVGSASYTREPRGPVSHNFAESGARVGLAEKDENFDMASAVDEASGKFTVCVEFAPSRAAV